MNEPANQTGTTPIISARWVVIATVICAAFFSFTNPSSGGSVVLMLGTACMIFGVYAWCALAVRLIASLWPIQKRTQRMAAIFLTISAAGLLVMQSIGQLSWRDVLVLVPLIAALFFYSIYGTRRNSALRSG